MRTGALIVALLGCVLDAGAEDRRADPAERAVRIVGDLRSDDARVRAAAVREFGRLGPDAIEPALRDLALSGAESPVRAAVLDALVAVGVEEAVATIQALRSAWPPGAGDLLQDLRRRRSPKLAARLALRPGVLANGGLVPPTLETRLTGGACARLGGRPVRIDGPILRIDEDGDGRYEIKAAPRKPAVVTTPDGERVLVYHELDGWWAAPASGWTGRHGRMPLEILDADGDGKITDRNDWIRWGDDGAFLPFRDGDLVETGGGLVSYRVVERDESFELEVNPERIPSRVDGQVRDVLTRLNSWRRTVGLSALLLDLPRSRACQAHCRYWELNGPSGHHEDPAKPGYTREGARAGKASSVGGGSPAFALWLHRTVLHRVTPTGDAAVGLGIGHGPGACVWTSPPSARARGAPILVPAPGQIDVPHLCGPEHPSPDRDPGFYARARGYPVSVDLRGVTVLMGIRLVLYRTGRRPAVVPGDLFSWQSPYAAGRNRMVTHFVASAPLERGRYVARFEGRRVSGERMTLVWSFSTARR